MGNYSTLNKEAWDRCKGWIEAAANTAPWPETIAEIEAKLEAGTYQLWPGDNSAAVTEQCDVLGRKALLVVHGGGSLDELLNCIEPALCAVAKEMGCEVIAGLGREGWKRACMPRGYKFAWLMMAKEL